jgi:hypothetical protein
MAVSETVRIRPRRRGPVALSRQATPILAKALAARGFENPQIVLRWPEFMGAHLGALTVPLSLSPEGVLTILAHPSASLILQHQVHLIAQRVNTALGTTAVASVKVKQSSFFIARPKTPQRRLGSQEIAHLTQATAPVADEKLRRALQSLGEKVMAARPPR